MSILFEFFCYRIRCMNLSDGLNNNNKKTNTQTLENRGWLADGTWLVVVYRFQAAQNRLSMKIHRVGAFIRAPPLGTFNYRSMGFSLVGDPISSITHTLSVSHCLSLSFANNTNSEAFSVVGKREQERAMEKLSGSSVYNERSILRDCNGIEKKRSFG